MPNKPRGPHHSAPCKHPTASGRPCPNMAREHHPEHGPVCALHAHHKETTQGRTATIIVHLHPDERRAVEIAANTLGVTMSDLARDMLVGLEIPEPPAPAIDVELHRELGRIGVNINQIARNLGRILLLPDRDVQTDPIIQDLLPALSELGMAIRAIQSTLGERS